MSDETKELVTRIELPVTVRYRRSRYYPAITSGPADDWQPAEGGEVESLQVFIGLIDITGPLGNDALDAIYELIDERDPPG